MRLRQYSTKWELATLTVIILLAVVVRMGWPGLTEFKADEARLLSLAWDMAEWKYFPIRGISNSAGFANPPMAVWLYALPLFVWKHLYAATLYTGLLNVLAIVGAWWLARRYWGSTAAFITALLLTVNPWAIHHARKIWAQNLIVPFVIGWAICGLLVYVDRRKWFLIGHFLCVAVAVQAHLAAISLVPATLMLLLIYWRRVDWRVFVIGALASILTIVPFGWYALQSGGVSSGSGLATTFSTKAFDLLWQLSTGDQIHVLTGSSFERFLAETPDLRWAFIILFGLAGVGLVRVVQRRSVADWFLLIWLAWSILFFVWEFVPVVLHYVIPVYPLPFLLVGIGVQWIVTPSSRSTESTRHDSQRFDGYFGIWKSRNIKRALLFSFLGIVVIGQLWTFGVLMQTVARDETFGGFGTPVGIELAAVLEAKRLQEEHDAFEMLVVSDGAFPEVDNTPAVYDVLLRGVPHRFVNGETTAVFPEGTTIYLAVKPDEMKSAEILTSLATDQITIPLRDPAQSITSYVLNSRPAPEYSFDRSFLLANFVSLYGYSDSLDSGSLDWQLHWQVGAGGSADYHWFNHLYSADGVRLQQADESAFYAGAWREGDYVVSFFTLPNAPSDSSELTMRSGMYIYPSLESVPVLDVAANPVSDYVEIELTE